MLAHHWVQYIGQREAARSRKSLYLQLTKLLVEYMGWNVRSVLKIKIFIIFGGSKEDADWLRC